MPTTLIDFGKTAMTSRKLALTSAAIAFTTAAATAWLVYKRMAEGTRSKADAKRRRTGVRRRRRKPTLLELGYRFRESDGRLVELSTGKPYKHETEVNREAICLAIFDEIQQRMCIELDMMESQVPWVKDDPELKLQDRANVFVSQELWSRRTFAVMLIQGSGRVRAGVWATHLCLTQDVNEGSQLNYLRRIHDMGGVAVVLNPNQTTYGETGKPLPFNSSPEEHTIYVYDTYIRHAAAEDLVIIAHSYGGRCVSALIEERGVELKGRLKAVALTDAALQEPSKNAEVWRSTAQNWVTSEEPLDTVMKDEKGIPSRSAGTTSHRNSTPLVMESVFAFIEHRLSSKALAYAHEA